jgi:hypothetical protein
MVKLPKRAMVSSEEVAIAGVQNGPGTTAFTRTPRSASSSARDLVKTFTAPLLLE